MLKTHQNSNKKGFSFLEAMITITIIGILAATASVSYRGYVKKTSIQTAQTTCGLIAAAIIQTYNSGVSIPVSTSVSPKAWAVLGITDPSDKHWTYSFPAIAATSTMTETYAVRATGNSGQVKGVICTFKPKAPGSARWNVN